MLMALQQTAAEKVWISLPSRNHLDMKYMRNSIEKENIDSISFDLGCNFNYFDKCLFPRKRS